jgi:mannose-6-phosphate isomerase class I
MMGGVIVNSEVIFLEPVLKETVWGGMRLAEYGYQLPSDHVGECWAISSHPNGDCKIAGGAWDGMTLSKLWNEHRELFGSLDGDVFPLLTKIIDAKEDLSIQVHPDDAYAAEHENGALGKTECWYVLDAKPDATIVIGHNARTAEEMRDMIENQRWSEFIREIPVKKGDFFQIEPGTLHAIKGGTLILETQQNSDITYRVYDYDRLSNGQKRELHLKQSMDVIKVPYQPFVPRDEDVRTTANKAFCTLVNSRYYSVWSVSVDGSLEIVQDQHFMLVSVISGAGAIDGRAIGKGTHLILPKTCANVTVTGNLELIVSAV